MRNNRFALGNAGVDMGWGNDGVRARGSMCLCAKEPHCTCRSDLSALSVVPCDDHHVMKERWPLTKYQSVSRLFGHGIWGLVSPRSLSSPDQDFKKLSQNLDEAGFTHLLSEPYPDEYNEGGLKAFLPEGRPATKLIVCLAYCADLSTNYSYVKLAFGQTGVPSLWIKLWNQTSLQERIELCLFAMQHHPVSSALLNLLVWSAIFEDVDQCLGFLLDFSPEIKFDDIRAHLEEHSIPRGVSSIVLKYLVPEPVLHDFIGHLFIGMNLDLSSADVFPQILLFPIEVARKTSFRYDFTDQPVTIDPIVFQPDAEVLVMCDAFGPKWPRESVRTFLSGKTVTKRIERLRALVDKIERTWSLL